MPLSDRPVAPSGASRDRRHRLVALLAVAVVLLAGCVSPKNQAAGPTPGATSPSPEATGDLARYYGQQLEWTTCAEGECATAQVPLDYADPAGASIGLALARSKATGGEPLGSLLLNPGGPGASGVSFLDQAKSMVGEDVQRQYDLVAFDPRGVQRSNPVQCVDGPALDQLIATDPDYSTDAGIQAVIDAYGELGAACLQNTGPALGHVDTVSAAKDMDVLRAALGEAKLDYLGASYGTKLGATYAELFPHQVGRFVLDGALDVTLTVHQLAVGQARGFQTALDAYVDNCVQTSNSCFLGGTREEGLAKIKDLLASLDQNPLSVGDRRLTEGNAFYGVALPLYNRDYWVLLSQALKAAFGGDGSALLRLSDAYASRNPDGSYADNSLEAFYAISCLDNPSYLTPAQAERQTALFQKVSPTLGDAFDWSQVGCVGQVAKSHEKPLTIDGAGAAPIVVVGTTRDPATPYAWAKALASQLDSGVLVSRDGDGHTGYHSGNPCVDRAVESYLVDGKVPQDGLSC